MLEIYSSVLAGSEIYGEMYRDSENSHTNHFLLFYLYAIVFELFNLEL